MGVDLPHLTALVFATPRADVEQAMGRLMRGTMDNMVIVDVVDNHEYFWRLFYRRRKFYNDAMCRVVMLNIENWMKLRNY